MGDAGNRIIAEKIFNISSPAIDCLLLATNKILSKNFFKNHEL